MAGRTWKRIRQRFGIAAPRVAVRTAPPWYWRWLGTAAILTLGAFMVLWLYERAVTLRGDAGPALRSELADTRRSLEQARAELDELRAVANAADSRVSIERSAQNRLAQQLRTLEQENARLREDLAIFDSLLSSTPRGAQSLVVQRFQVVPEVLPGEYRYRVLLFMPGARKERAFQGRLELIVALTEGGRNAIMSFPEPEDAEASAFRLSFKHFQRVEGTFRVGARARVESVQVRVYEAGSPQPRAVRSVKLG